MNYASAGAGSVHHLAGELFKIQTRTFITHIPYRGAGPALQDLIAGTVDMAFDGLGSSAGHIAGGRIKALMVAGDKRNPAIPDVPSAAELGLPQYDVSLWYGIWAPKGTPADFVNRFTRALDKLVALPEVERPLTELGLSVGYMSPRQLDARERAYTDVWSRIIRDSGFQPQ